MKLYIHGPYPPPIGGISIHIYRIEKYLQDLKIEYTILNHGFNKSDKVIPLKKSHFWYVQQLFKSSGESLYHFHQFMYLHFFFYFLKSHIGNPKIIITIHSSRILIYNKLQKELALFLLRHTRYMKLFVVSEKLAEYLNSGAINCEYLPAYVPPVTANKISLAKNEKSWFLFSMWKVSKELSEDTYDLPLALRFLNKVSSKHNMLFLVGSREESDIGYLENIIRENKLQASIKLIFNTEIINLVHNCDFTLRTNIHDGYGVSLQESMDLGVPAIASNVCTRPEGTVIFESENLESLMHAYRYVISNEKEFILEKKKTLTYHLELINTYQKILSEE